MNGPLSEAESLRVGLAIAFVHELSGHLGPGPCAACPRPAGVLAALEILDAAPRDARGARRALHDAMCVSGCGPESDHADRTQTATAAALRKFRSLNEVAK